MRRGSHNHRLQQGVYAHESLVIVRVDSELLTLQVLMGIWVVSGGEAITVSVYDPKAVQNLEITFLGGWWAELGMPPLKSMGISGLCGVAGTADNALHR